MELNELYRETILDHYQSPRGRSTLEHPTARAEGKNPLCGDEITLAIACANGVVENVAWDGVGCSISMASASMLAQELKGKSLESAQKIISAFFTMMQSKSTPDADLLGDLEVLEGVRKFPVRIKCALLPWTTLQEALKQLRHCEEPERSAEIPGTDEAIS